MLGIVDGTQSSTNKAAQHVSIQTVDKGYPLESGGLVVRLILKIPTVKLCRCRVWRVTRSFHVLQTLV